MLKQQLVLQGLDSTGWLLFVTAAIAAAAVLIVVLLRYERRLVPQKVGRTLLMLRLLTVGALLVTYLQPVLSWTLVKEDSGRILVALDVSQSMGTVDQHASSAGPRGDAHRDTACAGRTVHAAPAHCRRRAP